MQTKLALFTLLLCSFISMPSIAQTMDFENFADTDECPTGSDGVTQNGIRLGDNTPFDPNDPDSADSCVLGVNNTFVTPTNGTNVFGWCGSCAGQAVTVTIQREDAMPFQLQSIDVTRFPGQDTGSISISGYPAGGGSPVTVLHTIDSDTWETVSFDSSFSSLGRVEIVNTTFPDDDRMLDNIVLASSNNAPDQQNPIPVMGPFAYLLLMSGILLAARRRIRRLGSE